MKGTNLKMKNNAILDLFQEMAGIHASKCGQGTGQIETAWVLTAYNVNIIKMDSFDYYNSNGELTETKPMKEYTLYASNDNIMLIF
mgnify:CR=1 FL=1